MQDLRVSTERLELAPLTLDDIEALIAGDGGRLRELTGVLFPRPAAPPPYMADPLPAVRERLSNLGMEPGLPATTDELAKSLGVAYDRQAALLKSINFKPE